eukprot:4066455-Pleurochrysis_carterae.AAC.1
MGLTRVIALVHVVLGAIAEGSTGRLGHVTVAREPIVVRTLHEVVELAGIEYGARPRAGERDFRIIQHVA